MIIIRTNASTHGGMGHVMRMKHLSIELSKHGYEVCFLMDSHLDIYSDLLEEFRIIPVYDSSPNSFDEVHDAKKCAELISEYSVDYIICDDYRISHVWEDQLNELGYRIVVFDDLANREHNCDYIIDAKWSGEETLSRYDTLVPEKCVKLLGPNYVVLGEEYRDSSELNSEGETTILMSLGGGGDIAFLFNIVHELLNLIPKDKNIQIHAVVGLVSENSQELFNLAKQDPRIVPIVGAKSLYEHYKSSTLFFGALGTSLYELSALSIPSFTFSVSDNQENDLSFLEDFGNYFHLSKAELSTSSYAKLAEALLVLLENIERVDILKKQARIKVDAFGSKRIVESIIGLTEVSTVDYFDDSRILDDNIYKLNDNTVMREVTDSDVNHYLDSRNLSQNRGNMVVNEKIKRIEHYIWWFRQKRQSYLMLHNKIKMLYIWHQLHSFKSKNIWIGGWFVAISTCPFNIVTAALRWQIDITCGENKNSVWVAIIKKTNRPVELLNKYMGFQAVVDTETEYEAIRYFFNNPNNDEFNYIKLDCSNQ